MQLLQLLMQVSYIGRKGPPGCLGMHHNLISQSKRDNFLNKMRNYQICKKCCNPWSSLLDCLCVWFDFRVATEEARVSAAKQHQTMRVEAPFRTVLVHIGLEASRLQSTQSRVSLLTAPICYSVLEVAVSAFVSPLGLIPFFFYFYFFQFRHSTGKPTFIFIGPLELQFLISSVHSEPLLSLLPVH